MTDIMPIIKKGAGRKPVKTGGAALVKVIRGFNNVGRVQKITPSPKIKMIPGS